MATYDRPGGQLAQVLDSICRQESDYEVIVVDDGSPNRDEIQAVCDGFPVRFRRVDRAGGFRNPCTARNMAYRMAKGDVVIAQSDDVVHVTADAIERLAGHLVPGRFVLANVFSLNHEGVRSGEYVGPGRLKPYFFLGALWRHDLCAVGGNDEDFAIAPAYEDDWFADCLIYGARLTPKYVTDVVGHHLWHPVRNDLTIEWQTKTLWARKHHAATRGDTSWCASGGPWPFVKGKGVDEVADTEAVFAKLHAGDHYFDGSPNERRESASGPGSSLEATAAVREALPGVVEQIGARTFFDLCCGDCNWITHVSLGVDLYLGADIVPELVSENITKYGRGGRQFLHLDLLTSTLPKADLVLCRDCLVHLSHEDALRGLANICRSGSTYLLATTFTERRGNATIRTGEWTPYNLQLPPFNLPKPIEVINEQCREHYPDFTDKHLGLWRIADVAASLGMSLPIKSLVVCVEYDDFLTITLPRNKGHFTRTLVITAPTDTRTQDLVESVGSECHITDAFYRGGAALNKGAAIEEGFDVLGRDGWICVWDADIVMPRSLRIPGIRTGSLYVPRRRILEDPREYTDELDWSTLPSPTLPEEFDGYFQLFHASALSVRPWYGITWRHVGGGDNEFSDKFAAEHKCRPLFDVLHLGPEGIAGRDTRIGQNWQGRVTPRLDTGERPSLAAERMAKIDQMLEDRGKYGTASERLR
jgi:hypothetical protein